MDCVLMDIQKFLKKLETGQMEIEAGQWELHKDINNLKNSVQGLKDLKTDLQLMREHGLRQTDLIRELQCKLGDLEEISNKKDELSTTLSSSETSKNSNRNSIQKNRKKIRNHPKAVLHSGKVTEHQSQSSISNKPSVIMLKPRNKKQIMSKDEKQKVMGDSTQPIKRLRLQNTTQNLSKPQPPNLGILQRYLQDSAKYMKKSPQISCPVQKKIIKSHKSKLTERAFQHKPFDESSKEKTNQKDQNRVVSGEEEKYDCMGCSKQLEFKDDVATHKRTHNTKPLYLCDVCKNCFFCKSLLKKHKKVHQMSKCFRGFRCSYCDKVCKTPEKLTAHLKSCRIITRAHCRKK